MATVERDGTLRSAYRVPHMDGWIGGWMDGWVGVGLRERDGWRLVIIYLGLSVVWNSAFPFPFSFFLLGWF